MFARRLLGHSVHCVVSSKMPQMTLRIFLPGLIFLSIGMIALSGLFEIRLGLRIGHITVDRGNLFVGLWLPTVADECGIDIKMHNKYSLELLQPMYWSMPGYRLMRIPLLVFLTLITIVIIGYHIYSYWGPTNLRCCTNCTYDLRGSPGRICSECSVCQESI